MANIQYSFVCLNTVSTFPNPFKDPPPPGFFTVIVHKIILSKSKIPTGSISDKKLSVPRWNFSNYLMKIMIFIQLYRSKSATLEIAYDMQNRFLVMYSLISPQTTESKNNLYVHSNVIRSNPK